MELASKQHCTGVDRNPIFSIIRNALKFYLRESKFSKFSVVTCYQTPPSCDILCLQVLFVQNWYKLCIL